MSAKQRASKETEAPARAESSPKPALPPGDDEPFDAEPEKAAASETEGELTPERITELKGKAAKADEHWERLLRLTADFDNFKKRAARERQDAIKFANESLLAKLIPALDGFDMALAAAQSAEGNALESLKTGITMVFNQVKAALAEAGLEEIDATGQPFNPNLHEAVSQQESADVPEGHVIQQLRKGYKLRERLIRPATVVVAKNPAG